MILEPWRPLLKLLRRRMLRDQELVPCDRKHCFQVALYDQSLHKTINLSSAAQAEHGGFSGWILPCQIASQHGTRPKSRVLSCQHQRSLGSERLLRRANDRSSETRLRLQTHGSSGRPQLRKSPQLRMQRISQARPSRRLCASHCGQGRFRTSRTPPSAAPPIK